MDGTAKDLALAGAEQALDHANRELSNWELLAVGWVRVYARKHPYVQASAVREAAEGRGFMQAPDARAWGAIFKRAQAQKIVEATNVYEITKRRASHGRAERVWKSLIVES